MTIGIIILRTVYATLRLVLVTGQELTATGVTSLASCLLFSVIVVLLLGAAIGHIRGNGARVIAPQLPE